MLFKTSLLNAAATPAAGSSGAGLALTTISAAPTAFQTWQDPYSGAMPPELTVSLGLTVSPSYVFGGAIELPVNCLPDPSNPLYATFDTCGDSDRLKPLFVPIAPDAAALATLPDVANYSFDGDKITLTLKSNSDPGFRTGPIIIPLKFRFETDYLRQIPKDQYLWAPTAQAMVNATNAGTVTAATPVTGGSINELAYAAIFSTPADPTQYQGGSISVSPTIANNFYQQTDFDLNYQNLYYVEVPTGSTVSPTLSFLTWYKGGIAGVPSPVVNYQGSGYDRYYHAITSNANPKAAWNFVGSGGTIINTFTQTSMTFTPKPALTKAGQTVSIRVGSDTKRINGAPIKSSLTYTWTKINRAAWNLYFSPFHGTTGFPHSVCGTNDGDIGIMMPFIGQTSNYGSAHTTKNMGAKAVSGVRYEVYQNETDSRKINFDAFKVVGMRDKSDPANLPDWTRWKVEFVLKNPREGSVSGRTVNGGIFAPSVSAVKNYTYTDLYGADGHSGLLNMTKGDYIDRVIVTAMGKKGTAAEEGQFLPGNGIYFSYRPAAWKGQLFPDGTPIPQPMYKASVAWKLYYNDANGNQAIRQGDAYSTTFGYTPYALAELVSTRADGVIPGALVPLTVNGRNVAWNAVGPWVSPRIAVKVPKILVAHGFEGQPVGYSITLPGGLKEQTGSRAAADVTVTFTGADASYNYYSFQAAPNYMVQPYGDNTQAAFIIPINFRVVKEAEAGSYPIPPVLLSSHDAANFVNNYSYQNASNITGYSLYGFAPSDKLTSSPKTNTTVVVAPATASALSTGTSVASSATANNFINLNLSSAYNGYQLHSPLVPANQGDEVRMKLTLTNISTTPVSNIKLYDILPQKSDPLGSVMIASARTTFVGTTFAGTAPSAGSVKYATTQTLPTYGLWGTDRPDLSTMSSAGWATENPGAGTKAVFADFGSLTLNPGESTGIILTFHVPAYPYMTAYNQFRYSYSLPGATAPVNNNSAVVGFAVNMDTILYNANLPANRSLNNLSNMPTPNPETYRRGHCPDGPTGNDIAVSNVIPTLTGYTFTGWNDQADGSGTNWPPGSHKRFDAAGQLFLYAQWQANPQQ